MSETSDETQAAQQSDDARRAEANGTTAEVTFRGRTFTVPREFDEMSVDLVESVEEGKAVGIARGALGPDQWRDVRAMNLTMRELSELTDKIAVAMGFADEGESGASSA